METWLFGGGVCCFSETISVFTERLLHELFSLWSYCFVGEPELSPHCEEQTYDGAILMSTDLQKHLFVQHCNEVRIR